MARVLASVVCLLWFAGAAVAAPDQESGAATASNADAERSDAAPQAAVPPSRLSETLKGLRASLQTKRREIERAKRERDEAGYEKAREAAEARLQALHADVVAMEARFVRLVAQADESLFVDKPKEEFDPQERLLGLLKPILDEVEQATATAREISRLEAELGVQKKKQEEAARAVANVAKVLEAGLDDSVRESVDEQQRVWRDRLEDAKAQIASIEFELAEKRKIQKPFLDTASDFVRRFLRVRGLNLFLGILAFFGVYFGMGALRYGVARLRPQNRERLFADRLVDLGLRGFTLLAAIGAVLFVFNTTGDWFLLGIALTFLIGVGWGAIKAIPQFSHQITLVLNMGSVREGECIVFDGILWKVESLGFTTVLSNDRLAGGEQRLPVRMLVGRHSRPIGKEEHLFPTCAGDWILLGDDLRGFVRWQTPSSVSVGFPGGSEKVYPTTDFLALAPQNLSGDFRIEKVFGIDYRHQADSTRRIPAMLQERLEADLVEVLEEGELRKARVHFDAAAASSLDYRVLVDVRGSAAPRYPDIERLIARSLVESCNEHGWVIPFQQVTVHRAED